MNPSSAQAAIRAPVVETATPFHVCEVEFVLTLQFLPKSEPRIEREAEEEGGISLREGRISLACRWMPGQFWLHGECLMTSEKIGS